MYRSKLTLIETELAIKAIKSICEEHLAKNLNLLRVSSPVITHSGMGLNDTMGSCGTPIKFESNNQHIEFFQSLAKWKRMALYRYEIGCGQGLYANINAIRPCTEISNIHSIYVEQWDWEKVVHQENRTIDKLKDITEKIYNAIYQTEQELLQLYPQLVKKLPENITFIDSQELENMFPSLTPKEREYEIAHMHKAVFIMKIGHNLNSGVPHNSKSPDCDDWNLNGEMIFYHEPLDSTISIATLGIRVNAESLDLQLTLSGHLHFRELDFHKMIYNEVLPSSIGGSIGQTRLAMFLLEKIHIGEVQVSVWPDEMIKECVQNGIFLL